MTTPRHLVLPSRGVLMVSTDLHGNRADLEALRAQFEAARARGDDVHWALLGDLVHGPDAEAAQRDPRLHGFPDESPALIDAVSALRAAHPHRVHFVLGNHDAGHAGFPHTSKFHADEVEALEARLSAHQRTRLQQLCAEALLVMVAPCGVLLAHGSPGDALTSLAVLDGPLDPEDRGPRARAMNEVLWSYGQPREVTARLLTRIGAETGHALNVVVHGHDRDPEGWFVEGGNQVQPVIFGAPDENKRSLWLDLAARYASPADLREGVEVRRLYG